MAKFTIEIADADIAETIQANAMELGYRVTIPNEDYDPSDEDSEPEITNPERMDVFVNRKVREFLQGNVLAQRRRNGHKAADEAVDSKPLPEIKDA